MKKNFQLSLDEEKVEELKIWLSQRGLTFSGYMNTLIDEQLSAISMFAPAGDKSKVTPSKLLRLAGKMTKELKKELKR